MEGGVDGDDGNGDDCGDNDDGEDVLELGSLLEDEDDKEDEGVVGILIVNKNGGSILPMCDGCGKGIIGAQRYPGCSAYMHVFFGHAMGDGVSGQMFRCLGKYKW